MKSPFFPGNRYRYYVACSLALTILINLFPLQGFAAGNSIQRPTRHSSTTRQQEESSQARRNALTQQEEPSADAPSRGRRSPLAKAQVLGEFRDWLEQYSIAGSVSAPEQKGQELARQRRAVMAKLMQDDPASAVELAVPAQMRRKLPAEIQQDVEEQFSVYGDFLVLVFDGIDPATGELKHGWTARKVVIEGKTYQASVSGRMLEMTTKMNIPLRGVKVDNVVALAESPVRVLKAEDGDTLSAAQGVEAEVGGRILQFEDEEQLNRYEEKLKKKEMTIGPESGVAISPEKTGATVAEGEAATAAGMADAGDMTAASLWTEGPKTVLVIRVDFSDKPGEPTDQNGVPLTVANAQNLINTQCNNFYKNNSYNKTSLATTVTTVVRMPQPSTWYGTNNNSGQLMADARAAAKAAGFDTANYSFDIIAFKNISGFGWAGLGYLGGKGSWLNGYFDLRVTAHELGHNYGLHHANFWQPSTSNPIGAGTSQEYGDPFDVMGYGDNSGLLHFNTWSKNKMNWLTDADVQTVTASGTHVLQAFDSLTSTSKRALKIQKDASTHYWVEFRQALVNQPLASNGAIIHWGYTGMTQSNLLDMTPLVGGAYDSPLAVGQSFTDAVNGIKITTVSKSATVPATLSVSVTFTTNLNTLALTTSPVVGGNTVKGTVTLNAPAPTLGATVALSDNLAASTLPASVVIPAGLTSQTFTITTTSVASSQIGTVTASYRGVNKTAPLAVQPIALSTLTLNTSNIGGGGTVTGTVTLNGPAPATGATIPLSDSIIAATTPASVFIPAGLKTKTFSITTVPVAANQSGSVTATYGGVQQSVPLIVAPIALSSLVVSPASVAGGVNVTGTVILNGPAPSTGLLVLLSDNLPATTVPLNVTIPAGATSKTFNITSAIVAASQSGTVTATLGLVSKLAALTVRPPALLSVTLAPASVAGGNNVTGTVSLDGPAPAAGALVTLSDNLATATTPASATIAPGTTSKTFTITTTVVATKLTGAVTASYGAVVKTTPLIVRPVSVQSITVAPNPIIGGTAATGTILLERLSATNTVVTLTDNLPATTIPATVTVTAGTLSTTFPITTTLALPTQKGFLNATANGEVRSVALSVVNTQSQLLANPGFELGRVAWTMSSPASTKIIYNTTAGSGLTNTGAWSSWLGGYGAAVSEHIYQDVTIPANALSANLNFYLWLSTQETTTTLANDTVRLQIQNASGVVLATPAIYSNLNKTVGFSKKTVNLLPYKGQKIRVFFLGAENASIVTWFFLDDITLDIVQ